MSTRFAGRILVASILAASAVLFLCVAMAHAQGAGNGAITGTVTDPTGGAIANATVTITNKGTNETRETKTIADGSYTFNILPPGDYKLKFTAAGFKTLEIANATVRVTNIEAVNAVLQVGAVTESVTVESSMEVLQTESSTLGQTVSGTLINSLPMANQNYTEIISLSAGTNVGVANATSVGKGTQDISANGVNPGSNNFQMDGVAINNIANSGSANDGTIYGGIGIPSTDAIAEFKVQTSTYDASYGRNPGANVNLNTKSGTNDFHGSGFEFFRNSVLNADSYFYVKTPDFAHQVLDQNQFGGTIGGPIKKDKVFFFFSYRGTRSKNGVAPQGETFGSLLPTSLNPYAALGSRGTCVTPTVVPDFGSIASECDATAQAFANAVGIINVVGLRMYQLTTGGNAGVPKNYYIPAPVSDPQFCLPAAAGAVTATCNFSVPAIYNENQYVGNTDWIINSKNTLQERYFYQAAPQTLYLGQAGGDLPGTPVYTPWGNQNAVLRLTTNVTSNFINEARVSYQRFNSSATVAVPPGGCPATFSGAPNQTGCGSPSQLGMQPLVPGFFEPPTMVLIGSNATLFGGLLPFNGPTNQIQGADQVSWLHGKHAIRAGYEYEWTNWPLVDGGLQQGLYLTLGFAGLMTGGNGPVGPFWNVGCLFCVKGITGENGITHFYKLNNQSTYILDDWKVNSRLTLNMGLRWEYFGLLSDSLGRLSQVWLDRMVAASALPTAFSNSPLTIQQNVVPSNFEANFGPPPVGVLTANNRNSVQGHAPYSNFAPRFGFAWQPTTKGNLVVRGGFGIFYDRVGLDSVVHAFEQGSPYAATYDFAFLSPRWASASLARPYTPLQLVCMPSDPNCNSDFGLGFPSRWSDWTGNATTSSNSGLSTPFNPNSVHTPLVQEYSLGIQYEFIPGWVLDAGYVGSTGINLLDYNHNNNGAVLATPSNGLASFCTGAAPDIICNTSTNAAYRVPYPGYTAQGLQGNEDNGYSNFNSLQVTVRHQYRNGLTLQGAYTWSKVLTTVYYESTANINDALCLPCQYARASFNRPQRFVLNWSYDLPIGKNMSGAPGKIFGGWNVSGIMIAQNGDPLTPVSTVTGAAYGTNSTSYLDGLSTAQLCPGYTMSQAFSTGSITSRVGSTPANGMGYFNLNAFGTPAGPGPISPTNFTPCVSPSVPYGDPTATDYGNAKIGDLLGPGQFNWDISILKNTKLTERVNMQFRTDFYNAFNHPQFADPAGTTFGTIGFQEFATPAGGAATGATLVTNTNVNPRLIQFGLRFQF
jgi:hypothetical protein